jgi:all-trans-retinol dehydrogenase (NAD+)
VRQTPIPGTVVLITGASQGLGKATALRYAREKCIIVAWDVDDQKFPELIQDVKRAGGDCSCMKCDVSDSAEVEKCAKGTLALYHKVDILICNAGIVHKQLFQDLTPADFHRTFEVNVFGCVNSIRSFLSPDKLVKPSHVVVVSSVLAFGTSCRVSDYAATKHALHGFLTTLRLESKHTGLPISFTEVCPWHISTRMFQGWRMRWGLFPPVTPEYIADALFEAVCSKVELVVAPWYFWYVLLGFKLMPTPVHDWANLMMFGSGGDQTAARESKKNT